MKISNSVLLAIRVVLRNRAPTQTERTDVNKVPFLGDVPWVGALFRNTTRIANKTELLIFITPKVVTDRAAAR